MHALESRPESDSLHSVFDTDSVEASFLRQLVEVMEQLDQLSLSMPVRFSRTRSSTIRERAGTLPLLSQTLRLEIILARPLGEVLETGRALLACAKGLHLIASKARVDIRICLSVAQIVTLAHRVHEGLSLWSAAHAAATEADSGDGAVPDIDGLTQPAVA